MAKKSDFEYKNLTKSQRDCLGLIESLGIYELRALARVFGDNAPTTLKRNDHINIVMSKIISGEDLQPIPLRQGRPYKELSNIEGILSELSHLTGKDYSIKENQPRPVSSLQKVITFRQFEQDIVNKKMFPLEIRGVVCQKPDTKELYLINQDNNKLVLVKDARLKPFDYVTGTAVIMNEDKEYVLDTIKSINYQAISSYHEIIDEYFDEIPTQKFQTENQEIILGSRYLIKNKFLENEVKIKSLINKLKENRVITLALVPNAMYENFLSIKALGFNNAFLIKYDEKPSAIYDTLVMFVEHVKRLQNLGLNVALFVEDITTLATSIDYCAKSNSPAVMGHFDTTIDLIKKIIMLAKAGVNKKHTTLFTTLDDADLFDPFYVASVYKVSKKFN